jgi:hypothetical protein
MLGVLVLSGYALYYFAPEPLRPSIGLVHAAIGIALSVLLLWHRRGSRRAMPRHLHPREAYALRARRHHLERH